MIDIVGDKCMGCAACHDICSQNAISFVINKEGFNYPVINNQICTKCNICEKVCPVLNENANYSTKYTYAIKPKNYSFSSHSSSGSAFFYLAKTVIDEGGIVYGAAFDKHLYLQHCRVDNLSELHKLCGSKYIQSDCTNIYNLVKSDLKSNNTVLFVGTPCQVSGLKLFLRKDYCNLITIDLICHGVPSPGLFKQYISYCKKRRGKTVSNFLFRDNRGIWDSNFKSTLLFNDGTEEHNSMLTNLWNRIFFSELFSRKSCGECKFSKLERIGDITLGDFWGIAEKQPSFYDNRGVSLLRINTNTGNKLFQMIKENIYVVEEDTSESYHPNLYHPTRFNKLRSEAMNDFNNYGFSYIAKKYFNYTILLDFKVRLKLLLKQN